MVIHQQSNNNLNPNKTKKDMITRNITPKDKRELLNAEYNLEIKMLANPIKDGMKAKEYFETIVSTWSEFKARKVVIDKLYTKYDEDSVIRFVNKIVKYKASVKKSIAKLREEVLDDYNNNKINDEEAMAASKKIDELKRKELLTFPV